MQITIDNTPIYYVTHGEGFPIIILHGFYLDHTPMIGACEPIFEAYDGYQRIYMDMPGMGKTPSTGVTNSDDILKTILQFIDCVIPNQHFLLIGLSYGGYIARGVLKHKQSLIDGMMLIAPVNDANTRNIPDEQIIYRDPQAIQRIPDALQPMLLSTLAVQSQAVIERIVDEFIGAMPQPDQLPFLEQLRQPDNYTLSGDIDALVAPFDKPALILVGRQDTSVGYADAFPIADKYTRASYVALDRAGHGIHLEQDALYRLLCKEWLDRVEEMQNNRVDD